MNPYELPSWFWGVLVYVLIIAANMLIAGMNFWVSVGCVLLANIATNLIALVWSKFYDWLNKDKS